MITKATVGWEGEALDRGVRSKERPANVGAGAVHMAAGTLGALSETAGNLGNEC